MPTSGPEGSIDKVLQPDGTYKWEVVPHPRAEDLNPPTKKTPQKPKASPKSKTSLGGLTSKQKKEVTAPPSTFDNDIAE
tara:strand:- start:841 stop:1077 length:237 start_codon:yes stop_codon:yes gene_type:complete